MKRKALLFALPLFALASCGAENDAKDVCNCYQEVVRLKDDEAEKKMNDCIDLLKKYTQSHEEAGTLDEFTKAYNQCR